MSGLGPAACWLTHKRIESWSRMAKERVGAVTLIALDRNSDESGGSSTSASKTPPVTGANTAAAANACTATTTSTPPPPMTPPPSASSLTSTTSGIGSGAGSVSDSCDFPTDSEEVAISKEVHHVQPPLLTGSTHTVNAEIFRGHAEALHSPLHLHHQSRSFPLRLQRTPSVSSQSSIDSVPARNSGHRGSSPQIRTFGPDGRSSLPPDSFFPPNYSRSSNPSRAISLDARCTSPIDSIDIRNSQASMSSLSGFPNLYSGLSLSPSRSSRSLSPLLIPPRSQPGAELSLGPASPLGVLKPDLYRLLEGPVYITASGSSTPLGRLHLRVKYDHLLSDFVVHLIEAHNLNSYEDGGFHEPCVQLLLDPPIDNRQRQTLIHRNSSNQFFDRLFKFPISRDQLTGKELVLQVMDFDRYSHNDVIGEVRIVLDTIDLSQSVEIWGDISRTHMVREGRPELLCSLNYLPQAERLTIVIMKAKNLDVMHEPYVKVHLILNGKRIKKKKTTISRSDDPTNPVWNEAFSFHMQSSYLQSASVEAFIMGTGFEQNDVVSCAIGLQETGTGCQHWHDMINNSRRPTAMWHLIR